MVFYSSIPGAAGVIKIVCAWCKRDMGERMGGYGITHGICASCKALLMDELQQITTPVGRQLGTPYQLSMGTSPFRLYI
jgi:hypothetical protein